MTSAAAQLRPQPALRSLEDRTATEPTARRIDNAPLEKERFFYLLNQIQQAEERKDTTDITSEPQTTLAPYSTSLLYEMAGILGVSEEKVTTVLQQESLSKKERETLFNQYGVRPSVESLIQTYVTRLCDNLEKGLPKHTFTITRTKREYRDHEHHITIDSSDKEQPHWFRQWLSKKPAETKRLTELIFDAFNPTGIELTIDIRDARLLQYGGETLEVLKERFVKKNYSDEGQEKVIRKYLVQQNYPL